VNKVLLDTHALLWLTLGEDRLGAEARRLAETAAQENGLLTSAISFWEVALLERRGHLLKNETVSAWRKNVLDQGIQEIPVSGDIGIFALEMNDFHRDPADRIITATAISREAVLVTADARILAWQGKVQRHDARS